MGWDGSKTSNVVDREQGNRGQLTTVNPFNNEVSTLQRRIEQSFTLKLQALQECTGNGQDNL